MGHCPSAIGHRPSATCHWPRNFAIEYSSKLSGLPDEATRASLAEIVSFVLGRRLIQVGETAFALQPRTLPLQSLESFTGPPVMLSPSYPLRLRSWNPIGINVRDLCSKNDFPPVPIGWADKHTIGTGSALTLLRPKGGGTKGQGQTSGSGPLR